MTNDYYIDGTTTVILLNNGQATMIDTEDLPMVNPYNWRAYWRETSHAYYVGTSSRSQWRMMHRLICKTPKGLQTDHINHDTLDNRKANLRAVTASKNGMNRNGANRNSRLGIRGICLYTSASGRVWYRTFIRVNGRLYIKDFECSPTGLRKAKLYVTKRRTELTSG
jgi:hypothetical protein